MGDNQFSSSSNMNSLTSDILRGQNKARLPSMQNRDSPGEAFLHTAVQFAHTAGFSKEKSLLGFPSKCNPSCSNQPSLLAAKGTDLT